MPLFARNQIPLSDDSLYSTEDDEVRVVREDSVSAVSSTTGWTSPSVSDDNGTEDVSLGLPSPSTAREPVEWMQLVTRLARLCEMTDGEGAEELAENVDSASEELQRPPAPPETHPLSCLQCVVCADLPIRPLLCPSCGIMLCQECAARWWCGERSPSTRSPSARMQRACPHCRRLVPYHQLVVARGLQEMLQRARDTSFSDTATVAVPSARRNTPLRDLPPHSPTAIQLCCTDHQHEPLRYYCATCAHFICAECCAPLPDAQHRQHDVRRARERLVDVRTSLQQHARHLRERIQHLDAHISASESASEALLLEREHISRRVRALLERVMAETDADVAAAVRRHQAGRDKWGEARDRAQRLWQQAEEAMRSGGDGGGEQAPATSVACVSHAASLTALQAEIRACLADTADAPAAPHREPPSGPDDRHTIGAIDRVPCALLPPWTITAVPGVVCLFDMQWRVECCSHWPTPAAPASPSIRRSTWPGRRIRHHTSSPPKRLLRISRVAPTGDAPAAVSDSTPPLAISAECALFEAGRQVWDRVVCFGDDASQEVWLAQAERNGTWRQHEPDANWARSHRCRPIVHPEFAIDNRQLVFAMRMPDLLTHCRQQTRYIRLLERRSRASLPS